MKPLKALTGCLALTAIAALSLVAIAADKPAQAKITGEIVDSSCYMKMGAKGAGHEQCAVACAKAGVPLALVEDGSGNVIWLAANKDATNVNEQLIPYVAKKVTLTGKWYEKGGTKLFAIDKIEKVEPAPAK